MVNKLFFYNFSLIVLHYQHLLCYLLCCVIAVYLL